MSNSSEQEQIESIFSKLGLESDLEKENKKLKEKNELLEKRLDEEFESNIEKIFN